MRTSPIAGSWYEGDADKLLEQILLSAFSKYGSGVDFSRTIPREHPGVRLLGVVAPHAGYMYSGPTATHSYTVLKRECPDLKRVVIVGPDHRGMGYFLSSYPEGSWVTPLGEVRINSDLLDLAEDMLGGYLEVDEGYHLHEHSIDIQLPMLQYAYGDIEFLPIMMARQTLDMAKEVGEFLHEALRDEVTAVVASSDLSHESDLTRLKENDRQMLQHIWSLDLETANQFRRDVSMTMCGYGPVFSLMHATKLMEGGKAFDIAYTNSSMVAENSRAPYTVGYPSLAFFAP